jgi:adenylosuccinate lyase
VEADALLLSFPWFVVQATLLTATRAIRQELTRLSLRYRDVACIGRTHGQHAIPITMGFKFANFLHEMSVAEKFLQRVEVSS